MGDYSLNFKGKKFYPTLVKGKLSTMLSEKDQCIVQRSVLKNNQPQYSYGFFDSWTCFLNWYCRLSEIERTFSEVIMDGPQKFRIDIDIPWNEWKTSHENKIKIQEIIKAIEKVIHHDIKTMLFESIDKQQTKYSFHLIVTNLAFPSASVCRSIALAVKQITNNQHIDTEVYKRLQCFRIEGSRKCNSYRYKYLESSAQQINLSTFLNGIISHVEGCTMGVNPGNASISLGLKMQAFYRNAPRTIKGISEIQKISKHSPFDPRTIFSNDPRSKNTPLNPRIIHPLICSYCRTKLQTIIVHGDRRTIKCKRCNKG